MKNGVALVGHRVNDHVPSPAAPLPSSGDPASWPERRRELLRWLNEKAPPLAELYEAAVVLLTGEGFPARHRLLAHAAREICNGLPDYLLGHGPGRVNYPNHLNNIVRLWKAEGLPLDQEPSSSPSATPSPSASLAAVPVPLRVYVALQELIKEHDSKGQTRRERSRSLIRVLLDEEAATREHVERIVVRWFELSDWFQQHVHDSRAEGGGSDWNEYASTFLALEELMISIVGSFFRTVGELDEILDEANR